VLFSEALPISAGSAYLSRKPRLCTYAILCNTSQRGRACLSRFSRSLPLLLAPRLSPIEREPSMDPRLCAPAISFLPVGHSASARFFERRNTSARVRSGVKSHERVSVQVSGSERRTANGAAFRVLADSREIPFGGRCARSPTRTPEERARRVSRERGKEARCSRSIFLGSYRRRNIALGLAGKWRRLMPRRSNDRPRSRANVLDKNAVSLAPFFHGGPPTATERRFKTPPRPSPAKGFPFPRRPSRRVAPLSPSLCRSYRAFRPAPTRSFLFTTTIHRAGVLFVS